MIGRRTWAFPGGHIPASSTGPEPEYTSRDELCVLNTADQEAHLELTVFHTDGEPVSPYRLTVGARRVRHVRINDLVDPQAVFLAAPYGLAVQSDVPVVVRRPRRDSRRGGLWTAIAPGFAEP